MNRIKNGTHLSLPNLLVESHKATKNAEYTHEGRRSGLYLACLIMYVEMCCIEPIKMKLFHGLWQTPSLLSVPVSI